MSSDLDILTHRGGGPTVENDPLHKPGDSFSDLGLTVEDVVSLKAEAEVYREAAREGAPMFRAETMARAIALDSLADQAEPSRAGDPDVGNGGEAVLRVAIDAPWRAQELAQATRESPALLKAKASRERLKLAQGADVLTLAVDAAERSRASTPATQMLAHQLAASHRLSMELVAKSQGFLDRKFLSHLIDPADAAREQVASIEACRLATASARLMEASARAAMTLDRLQNGSRQTIVIQQKVEVQPGGQAMVNGAAQIAPRRTKKRRRKS